MYGKTLADYPERMEQFLDEFRGANPELLDKAFAQARGGVREFPTPADVRRFYDNLTEIPRERKDILEREAKPPDWGGIGKKAGFSKEAIADMLEAGKEAQAEHIAKLEADPEWQAMARKLGGFPGLQPKERPVEEMKPDEKARWAKQKAKDQGWT